jgi:hypothetical protein
MLEVRGGLDLLQESLGADDRRDLGAEHLDRDFAIVAHVVREVDHGHRLQDTKSRDAARRVVA